MMDSEAIMWARSGPPNRVRFSEATSLSGAACRLFEVKKRMPESSPFALPSILNWISDVQGVTERIKYDLSGLHDILDEKQLTRYRERLEAEPACRPMLENPPHYEHPNHLTREMPAMNISKKPLFFVTTRAFRIK